MNHTGVWRTGRPCAASMNATPVPPMAGARGRSVAGTSGTSGTAGNAAAAAGAGPRAAGPGIGADARVVRPMTQQHPDLADEQAYIGHAYDCLDQSRNDAWKLRDIHEGTLGGTFQARYERDVFDEALVNRLTKLDLGDAALVF